MTKKQIKQLIKANIRTKGALGIDLAKILNHIVNAIPESVEIPVASVDTLGGVKVGDGLSVTEDGTLSSPLPIDMEPVILTLDFENKKIKDVNGNWINVPYQDSGNIFITEEQLSSLKIFSGRLLKIKTDSPDKDVSIWFFGNREWWDASSIGIGMISTLRYGSVDDSISIQAEVLGESLTFNIASSNGGGFIINCE